MPLHLVQKASLFSQRQQRCVLQPPHIQPIFKPSAPLPFVNKVCLVADQEDDYITATLSPHFLNPAYCVQEGLPICRRHRAAWHSTAKDKPAQSEVSPGSCCSGLCSTPPPEVQGSTTLQCRKRIHSCTLNAVKPVDWAVCFAQPLAGPLLVLLPCLALLLLAPI